LSDPPAPPRSAPLPTAAARRQVMVRRATDEHGWLVFGCNQWLKALLSERRPAMVTLKVPCHTTAAPSTDADAQ